MRIAPSSVVTTATVPAAAPLTPAANDPWTNPAAAAALHSTVDLLAAVETGIVRNFTNADLVRAYAADLRSTVEIFENATLSIMSDASKENDSFLPLIDNAGSSAAHAEVRLSSKELHSTWPIERSEILATIRRARAISQNVADQLDPRSVRQPR